MNPGISHMAQRLVDSRPRARRTLLALLCGVLMTPAAAAAAGGPALFGAGVSRLPGDTRVLAVHAATTDGAVADGRVTFAHRSSANGLSRFSGTVSCLRIVGATAQISGTVTRGRTAAGVVLTGKQYAFTLMLGEAPTFSLPRFADQLVACGGGRPETVAVTAGGFRTR